MFRKSTMKNGLFSFRSRGYIPHYEADGHAQLITYRLNDSLPAAVLVGLDEELEHDFQRSKEIERVRHIEECLDKGAGSCVLANHSIAQVIEQNLLHFEEKRYKLHAWVIMPNHVHVLITPAHGVRLPIVVHSWKSYTAKKANTILGLQGEFWQREYFDRMIRSERHFAYTIAYIHNNPVKAGLCRNPEDWQFSSAAQFSQSLGNE